MNRYVRATKKMGLLAMALSALFLLALTSQAIAVPIHPALPDPIKGFALNHACGSAVDSVGDIYVSSAGASKVEVFNPAGSHLASIPDVNEPCGLAVNGKGELFVSEQATGTVVRYKPTVYPLTNAPAYGAAEPIDSSGAAKGIAVDPHDNRLYVAEGDRIAIYTADGSFETNLGEGNLTDATGVAAYSYLSSKNVLEEKLDLYLFVADGAGSEPDRVQIFGGTAVTVSGNTAISNLALRRTVNGSATPDGSLGFGAKGSAVGVDRTNGHFQVFDEEHHAIDEFEASGAYLDRIASPAFADAEPTGIAVVPQRDEVQEIFIKAAGGSYTLSFEGQSTAPIPFNAGAAAIQVALGALSTIGVGNVSVHGEFHQSGLPAGNYVVDFQEALGAHDVSQLLADGSGLTGPSPLVAAVTTLAQGSGPGVLYVTAGAGPAAKLLAFGPLAPPSRLPLPPPLSHTLANAQAVATDSRGDVYVAAGSSIHIYGPTGGELAQFSDPHAPLGNLAVDSAGHIYVLEKGSNGSNEVVYYTPDAYPPMAGTTYLRHEPALVTGGAGSGWPLSDCDNPGALAVNPTNDHLFVATFCTTRELDSVAHGSTLLNGAFAAGVSPAGGIQSMAVGLSGNVYFGVNPGLITVVNSAGTEVLARIRGADGPRSYLASNPRIAVDQANGHVLSVGTEGLNMAQEYDASGAFVAEFGKFSENVPGAPGIAVDSSCALHDPPLSGSACEAFDPANGNAYVAFDDPAPGSFDVSALGPLAYGEPPTAVSGVASGVGAGNATLNGTVDPRGFELTHCRFEYLGDAQYIDSGEAFTGTVAAPCAETAGEIGKGNSPVSVHADLSGLDPEGRYRFRLVAENKYGHSQGAATLFGAPVITTRSALPIFYTEATVRARVDPSGLATEYHFEYGTSEAYGQSTPIEQIGAGAPPTDVQAALSALGEGTTYHFRVVAKNEAMKATGPDQTLRTLLHRSPETCANVEFRTGLSANLPDCRAYELVTPAETNGLAPYAADSGDAGAKGFNNWLATPRGAGAGESLTFDLDGTLPGFDGTGTLRDGYLARRSLGEGPNPAKGWITEHVGPGYAQAGGGSGEPRGTASDQRYSIWSFGNPRSTYLRTPSGFEPLGSGSLGIDLEARGRYVSPGAGHVVFSSKAQLEEAAPPAGTEAIYDRAGAGASAAVLSLLPGEVTPGAGEDAVYAGGTEDGAATAFEVGGALYLRRGEETVEVAGAPNTFAGISADGRRVFYVDTASLVAGTPAGLWACDVEAGSCAGSGASHEPIEIAPASVFVYVSADGSHVFLTSHEVLDEAEEGVEGEDNLYLWDGGGTHFLAALDPRDLVSFGENTAMKLSRWTSAIGAHAEFANTPARSTPGGGVFVFQSHAKLTDYENEGHGEIYRYDGSALPGARLLCVSCDPSGAPASADAMLQSTPNAKYNTPAQATTLIANLTDDGQEVFFQSKDRLLPEDANAVQDVYEWTALGSAACTREAGCLALVSSGQGEFDNFLYSASADGHDVFFTTPEKLVAQDTAGSPSIYDARVQGGIPDRPAPAPCKGDACQGNGSSPPALPAAASTGSGTGNVGKEGAACRRGKQRIKGRCVKRHHKLSKHKRSQGRASHHRRAGK